MRLTPLVALLGALGLGLVSATPAAAQVIMPPVPVPPENPITPAKALLGKALFWDEQLSSTGAVACGTCHFPGYGGSDKRSQDFPGISTHPGSDQTFGTEDDVRGSPGVVRTDGSGKLLESRFFRVDAQVTPRKAPSFINAGFAPELFWDGSASGTFRDPLTNEVLIPEGGALENQALGPPVSSVEMGHLGVQWPEIVERIAPLQPLALASELPTPLATFVENSTYTGLFERAFGTPEVTPARVAMALATYQRTLVSDRARIDSFPLGFTPQERLGGDVFDAHCVACHKAPLFTLHTYRNIGVRPPQEDVGRAAVTGLSVDAGKFRVPSLRNVQLRAPYMHNGSIPTLEGVIAFYDRGGNFEDNQDPLIEPLGLTQVEKDALLAYLLTFTDNRVHLEITPFDRPRLFSESTHVADFYGEGTPGSEGLVPKPVIVQPPSRANAQFTVGLDDGRAGSQAMLLVGLEPYAAGLPLLGATAYLDLSQPFSVFPSGELKGSADGVGYDSIVFDLSSLGPNAKGVSFYGQWFVDDPGATGELSASRAFQVTIL